MLNIVLFGPPGAGKGTQSAKLIKEFQLVHLSTGDILRSEVAAGTELGLRAKELMAQGNLVPDEIVIGMISEKLDQNKHAKGFIFDGFPRTEKQAMALDKLLAEKNTAITKMISLKVTDEELMERLLKRGQETGRPDDQNEDIILNRIQEYNAKTAPLEDYYEAQGKFEAIDGIGNVDEIFYAISAVIEEAQIEEAFSEEDDDSDEEEIAFDDTTASNGYTDDETGNNDNETIIEAEFVAIKVTNPKAKKAVAKPVKKATKKVVKKAAPKKAAKKQAKKVAPKKIVKKQVKKAAKKVAPKKTVKKAAKKITPKKVVKKVTAKKSSKKVIKKVASKKAVKKQTKKIAPKKLAKKQVKKVVKKAAPKKAIKKSVKKAVSKKAAPKKAIKKAVKRRK